MYTMFQSHIVALTAKTVKQLIRSFVKVLVRVRTILGLADLDFSHFNYRVSGEANLLKRRFQNLFGWGFKLDNRFFHSSVRLRSTTIAGFQIDIFNPSSFKDVGCTYNAGKPVKLDLRYLRVDYKAFHGSCLPNLKQNQKYNISYVQTRYC